MEATMSDEVIRLYPQPGAVLPLQGLYLASDLRGVHAAADRPFVFTNFVSSIDGRIAIVNPGAGKMGVPHATANPRDWRLFQELAAQADVMITTGSHLRHRMEGDAQEISTGDDPRFADLRAWRKACNLAPRADLAVVSRSLDFPYPADMAAGWRKIIVVTGGDADRGRIKEIEAQGGSVIVAGEAGVDGAQMVAGLAERGYRLIYSVAGPAVAHILLASRVLDRLYITLAHRLLGGEDYTTFVEGLRLDPPVSLRLAALYLDPYALEGAGQLFATYDVAAD